MNKKIKFFLGANSHKGFISYFEQLQGQYADLQLLILKGGPGSGKSSLMKRVADFAEKRGHYVEFIPCASDPHSLDAFIDRDRGFAMVDGTSPHVLDPKTPGAGSHIMYTGQCWDCSFLRKNREDIVHLQNKIENLHKSATAYIKAAGTLFEENYRLATEKIKKNEISSLAEEIIQMLPFAEGGKETKRLLSAVSVGEIVFFSDTLEAMANKIYAINDKWGAASDMLLKAIRDGAVRRGVDVISCHCSVIPDKIEHIIIPTEKIAITTSNAFHSSDKCAGAIVDGLYKKEACRFTQFASEQSANQTNIARGKTSDFPTEAEKRIEKAYELLDLACKNVEEAKKMHDKLEAYYVKAMDFSKIETMYEEIIDMFY